ncbi:MAG: AraC family transcriptional regulator [Pseudomonadota bacterium]
MRPDPIVDIVKSIGVTGAVFLHADFSAPWAINAHVDERDCADFMPMPRQLIAYHVVLEGCCFVSVTDTAGRQYRHWAKAGDVLIFPHNTPHFLASEPGLPAVNGTDLVLPTMEDGFEQIRHGGGGDKTRIWCGFMGSNSGASPLLDTLPAMMVIPVDRSDTRNWIRSSVTMAANRLSSDQRRSTTLINGMCELLLAEALRISVASAAEHNGWLNGMAHPRMAKALARIHSALECPPSVAELAREVGMSRSAFVERFTEVLGVGPRQYMLDERMKLAAALLRDGQLTASEIALRVGYDAPEAFSRAFKRQYGLAPRHWRVGCAQDHAATPVC